MPYRICLISLGCAKNQVNSEQMLYLLNQAGHEVVGEVDGCDVAIVNTCGFIDSAKSEAIDQILQLAEVKKAGGLKKILVTGCLSQRYEKDILESLPEVDGMLGTGSFGQICAAVEDVMHDGRPLYFGDKSGPIEEIGRVVTTGPGWAYLRIAEGCDNWCAFCAIPAIRGRYRSRALDAIVQEARELADLGVKELIVIAQDITRWGMDLYGKPSLALLLRELAKIDGIRWIRLHYLYPEIIDDELIDLIANEDKIVKYLDIPIQHIDNDILRRMNRHCTGDEIRALLQKLRARIPGLVLRTSLITGLPGEGEAEFEELCTWLREVRLARGRVPVLPRGGDARRRDDRPLRAGRGPAPRRSHSRAAGRHHGRLQRRLHRAGHDRFVRAPGQERHVLRPNVCRLAGDRRHGLLHRRSPARRHGHGAHHRLRRRRSCRRTNPRMRC